MKRMNEKNVKPGQVRSFSRSKSNGFLLFARNSLAFVKIKKMFYQDGLSSNIVTRFREGFGRVVTGFRWLRKVDRFALVMDFVI